MDMAPRTLININFPAIPAAEVQGIRVTRQGFHDYGRGSIVEGTDPRGYRYYWFGLHGIEHSLGHDSDLEAIDDQYISGHPAPARPDARRLAGGAARALTAADIER